MTKDEALKMAEQFGFIKYKDGIDWASNYDNQLINLITALEQPEGKEFFERGKEIARWADKQALEQPAQEPVGKWESNCKCDFRTKLVGDGCKYCNTEEYICKLHSDYDYLLEENEQLITRPHQWQGLTDDEIAYIINDTDTLFELEDFARAIEQALRIKNG